MIEKQKSQELKYKFKSAEEFERVLGYAESNAVTAFEMEFCASMRSKYNRFGMGMFFSNKQEEVLDRVAYPGPKEEA